MPLKCTAAAAAQEPGCPWVTFALLQALEDCLVEACRGAGPSCALGKQAAPFQGTLNEEQQAGLWGFSWTEELEIEVFCISMQVSLLLSFLSLGGHSLFFFFFPSLALSEKGLRLS